LVHKKCHPNNYFAKSHDEKMVDRSNVGVESELTQSLWVDCFKYWPNFDLEFIN